MVMPLAAYQPPAQVLSAAPESVTFGPAQPRERAAVLAAAEQASAGWSVFFDQHYENAWVARAGDEVIGCLLAQPQVTLGAGFPGPTGGLACVGVVPRWRQQGIGLKLAAVATAELARQGLMYSYVGYTWLEGWYGRIGYRPHQYFWMGEKAL
jgi:ribosomal protein S18 acetylase RimI-like enzyme